MTADLSSKAQSLELNGLTYHRWNTEIFDTRESIFPVHV